MTPEEIFEFDLRGFIIFRGLLDGGALMTLNKALARVAPSDPQQFAFIEKDPAFMDLMEHPRILSALRLMIGDWFRLDHVYAITMKKGTGGTPTLHGGPRTDKHEHQYEWREGRMYNGLMVVSWALSDMGEGDGGFLCVPGSHKSNLLPTVREDSPLVVQPAMKAGDALIFTEALIHGTRSWTAPHERRSLLYKYSPGHSCWADYDEMKVLLPLARTAMQKALLRPAYVGNRDPLPFPG